MPVFEEVIVTYVCDACGVTSHSGRYFAFVNASVNYLDGSPPIGASMVLCELHAGQFGSLLTQAVNQFDTGTLPKWTLPSTIETAEISWAHGTR